VLPVRGAIKAGELCQYFPANMIGNREGRIAHYAGAWDEGSKVSLRCYQVRKEQQAVNDFAGDGLDSRWEDQCADICGL